MAIERGPKITNEVDVEDDANLEMLESILKQLKLLNERFEEAFETRINEEDI